MCVCFFLKLSWKIVDDFCLGKVSGKCPPEKGVFREVVFKVYEFRPLFGIACQV